MQLDLPPSFVEDTTIKPRKRSREYWKYQDKPSQTLLSVLPKIRKCGIPAFFAILKMRDLTGGKLPANILGSSADIRRDSPLNEMVHG
jgi:hypothetical protein